MAYCVYTDLEARIGVLRCAELTNDTSGATTTDQTIAGTLIADADLIIDAKMTGVYATPFSSVPKLIKWCSIHIAIYNAFLRRFANMEVPKEWIEKHKMAMQFLDDIANLKMSLDTAPAVASAESAITAYDQVIDFNDADNAASYF